MESRHGPVGVETVYFHFLRVNLRCQITQTFYHIPDGSLMKMFSLYLLFVYISVLINQAMESVPLLFSMMCAG
mgnify:CR=1 FL=1